MTYKETIDFLFSSLPMYQRVGDIAIKKDLTNIRKLCTLLEDPHQAFISIHVAGTNGKGSTSHMLASVFQASGKKVGLYTSPHYIDFRERIKINGEMISEAHVVQFVARYREKWQEIQPSFFEITVAMAFDFFRNEKIDIAIIETGLGGRLDSTNIITPALSVITNIGYDHMQVLGNTLEEIASEKAGIIKLNTPVVIGEWQEETSQVFIDKAEIENASIFFASQEINVRLMKSDFFEKKYVVETHSDSWKEEVNSDLLGPYQSKNLATVIEACLVWNKYYPENSLSKSVIIAGLRNVKTSTNMIGRWMIIDHQPLVITDAAHNVDGIKNIISEINEINAAVKHFVLGFVNDKDISKILSLFPTDGNYYWCRPDIPRGKPVVETEKIGLSLGLKGEGHESVSQAYEAALANARDHDFIFVGGSSYVVGDYLASIGFPEKKKSP